MTEKENEIEIEPTFIYGFTGEDSKVYDMEDILGKNLLDYKISKIKCFVKSNKSIYGIQFIYRNIFIYEEKAFIDVKSKEKDLIEQEMDLSNEDIKDLRVWLDQDIKLLGFEVITNKNRIQKFGYGDGEEQLRTISDLKEGDKVIVGFGCYADDKDGVTAIYGYYVNRKKYNYHRKYFAAIYSGILSLRVKIKDPKYKEKIERKVEKMDVRNKILFRVAQLPDYQFYNILKYSIE